MYYKLARFDKFALVDSLDANPSNSLFSKSTGFRGDAPSGANARFIRSKRSLNPSIAATVLNVSWRDIRGPPVLGFFVGAAILAMLIPVCHVILHMAYICILYSFSA